MHNRDNTSTISVGFHPFGAGLVHLDSHSENDQTKLIKVKQLYILITNHAVIWFNYISSYTKSVIFSYIIAKAGLFSCLLFHSAPVRCCIMLLEALFRRNNGSTGKEEDKLNVLCLDKILKCNISLSFKMTFRIIRSLICCTFWSHKFLEWDRIRHRFGRVRTIIKINRVNDH